MSRNRLGVTTEQVLEVLKSYRCHHQKYSDDDGAVYLLDALTPAGDRTMERGEEELELLASYVAAELSKNAVLDSHENRTIMAPSPKNSPASRVGEKVAV
jgi:hypothetical protein